LLFNLFAVFGVVFMVGGLGQIGFCGLGDCGVVIKFHVVLL